MSSRVVNPGPPSEIEGQPNRFLGERCQEHAHLRLERLREKGKPRLGQAGIAEGITIHPPGLRTGAAALTPASSSR